MVGASITRVDDREKVTGEARYAADLKMTGVLHAKVLRSKVHHARIISIDTSAAEAVPGIEAVVTAKDIPGSPEMPNAKPQRFLFPPTRFGLWVKPSPRSPRNRKKLQKRLYPR